MYKQVKWGLLNKPRMYIQYFVDLRKVCFLHFHCVTFTKSNMCIYAYVYKYESYVTVCRYMVELTTFNQKTDKSLKRIK